MQSGISTVFKDLVLLGGGHAHVQTVKMFGMNPVPGVRVTLISRDVDTPYSGMLPGLVAGVYTHEETHIDLVKLCSFASVRFIHAEASSLNTDIKKIFCRDGRPPISYDVLSIDIGITPKPLENGLHQYENITAVKPIDKFDARWKSILNRILNHVNPSNERFRVAIVGGGAGGCELCFSMHYRLVNELRKLGVDPSQLEICLLTEGDILMRGHAKRVQEMVVRILKAKGIKIIFNCRVTGCIPSQTDAMKGIALVSGDGLEVPFDECFWCTQAHAQSWLKSTKLDTTEEGFVCVSSTLESTNVRDVFACGDIAHLTASPRPKAGVFAVRAGPPLTRNLRSRLLYSSKQLEEWTPQDQFLGIIGTFGKGSYQDEHWGTYAIASKSSLSLEGEYLWQLKDKIDKDFMALFSTALPDKVEMMKTMKATTDINEVASILGSDAINILHKTQMRCGGCGSKVGSTILSRVLKIIGKMIPKNKNVVSGVGGGDDAAIVLPPPANSLSVHTIDYFRSFISDPYVFGRIAANHALSDAFAMNATATSALALCVIPFGVEPKLEAELLHMLAGCVSVLNREGCALVGGHTSEGSEPALGLAVNGFVEPSLLLRKGPMRVGEVVVLTKGLGTGTIMAADMRAKANGVWVHEALQSMQQSNREAASILRKFGSVAATDVTGFGFMGHLLEMIKHRHEPVQLEESSTVADANIYCSLDGSCAAPDVSSSGSNDEQVAVQLDVGKVPLLTGALDCIRLGVLSSLQPENLRSARAVGNASQYLSEPVFSLLFDPQTSGGLLATLPSESAEAAIAALHQSGYRQAAVIGKVVPRESLALRVDQDDIAVWLN